jgi:O-acetyl-ADP-ribose deacetylase (regulator of RNase III)
MADFEITLAAGRTITLKTGDITRESVDAIVNAANSSLMGGGGVDGAIHRAGGPAILDDCKKIHQQRGPLPPGQAVATTGGRLPAHHVIHTVGPIWEGGNSGEPDTLASCYRECIRLAEQLKLTSLAFPSISTGAFGYPVHEAAEIALRAVAEALSKSTHLRELRFVLFDERTFDAYARAARETQRQSQAESR